MILDVMIMLEAWNQSNLAIFALLWYNVSFASVRIKACDFCQVLFSMSRTAKKFDMQTARLISAQRQSCKTKLAPLIPETCSVGVFIVEKAADVLFALMSKTTKPLKLFTKAGHVQVLPEHSRFLRRTAATSPFSITGFCSRVMSVLKWPLEFLGRLNLSLTKLCNMVKQLMFANWCHMTFRLRSAVILRGF